MARKEREELIQAIQSIRKRKLVTLVTTTRSGVLSQLEPQDVRVLRDHVAAAGKNQGIDLFLVTLGGVSTVPWAMSSLLREFNEEFSVIIPGPAFSAGTSLALGANDIIMGPLGTLGPVDPQVANDFNPEIQGKLVPISVEDLSSFAKLLTDKFAIKDERNFTSLINRLVADVRPLALGNAYRHYIKARDDTRKLLELHMDPMKDQAQIERIVDTLVEKLYFHGHHITRRQAKEIGLKTKDAEAFPGTDGKNLADLTWNLYTSYEKDMQLMIPYRDSPPAAGGRTELTTKMIECETRESRFVIEQEWTKMNVPASHILSQVNGVPAAVGPNGQVVPLIFQGQPVVAGNTIYDKREYSYWKGY